MLRDRFFDRLAMADALLDAPSDRELRAKLVAIDAGLTRGQRVRLGVATGLYQLLSSSPGVAALAAAITVMWVVYGLYRLVEAM